MVEIGGQPILWHIMKHYAHYGHRRFLVALGYKGEVIRQFATCLDEPWELEPVDTGEATETGGRVKRLGAHLDDGTFMLTWGDGVANVDLDALLEFHRSHDRLATVTAVRPPPRFGRLRLRGDQVAEFSEKSLSADEWVNGAYFVLARETINYIDGDHSSWEHDVLPQLTSEGQLMAYRHESFWQCMDTIQDRHHLEELWSRGNCPWQVWE